MSDLPQTVTITDTALSNLTTRFLDSTTSAEARQALRRTSSTPAYKLAFEQWYVDGTGFADPRQLIRHTLAALFMTRGFTSRDSAQQILAELREYANEQHLDFDRIYAEISNLPGARRSGAARRRLILLQLALIGVLSLGTGALLHWTTPPLQMILQLLLLVGVITAQLILLYRHLN